MKILSSKFVLPVLLVSVAGLFAADASADGFAKLEGAIKVPANRPTAGFSCGDLLVSGHSVATNPGFLNFKWTRDVKATGSWGSCKFEMGVPAEEAFVWSVTPTGTSWNTTACAFVTLTGGQTPEANWRLAKNETKTHNFDITAITCSVAPPQPH